MTVSNYIETLLASEVYAFSLEEARQFCNKSEIAVKSDIYRLIDKKKLVNLRKGFYLILPPRYAAAQKLPVQLYCEKLFSILNRKYYLSLFTAAKLHGSGHQQIQQDYITTKTPKLKDISKENIKIRFFTSGKIPNPNIEIKQSEGGIYRLS
ncbi:MAG: type IV toxin-antitoxin system AbiEi family antitoxin domain-containing protein, partial [Bacteroidota bacterium]